jgi:hypothetical protein
MQAEDEQPRPTQHSAEPNTDQVPLLALPVAKGEAPTRQMTEFEFVDDPEPRRYRRVSRRLRQWVRWFLLVLATVFVAVLGVAVWLNPYDDAGHARTMSTHTQLGLEPCTMVVMTGKPCPACGMTTSFALLMHGDVANSMRANWVGTLFCFALVLLTPWLILSAIKGRLYGVTNGELFSTVLLTSLLFLMTIRWLIILIG